MKRNLILVVAILATSIAGFAVPAAASCDNGKSTQSADQHKHKKQKKTKKSEPEQKQDTNGFSIYG